MQCCAIKSDGNRCTTNVIDDTTRCKTHRNVILRKGNNATRRAELKYTFEKNSADIQRQNSLRGLVDEEWQRVNYLRRRLLREEKVRYDIKVNELENVIATEFAANGFVDPDAEILRQAQLANNARVEARRQLRVAIANNIMAHRAGMAAVHNPNGVPVLQHVVDIRNLGAIAQDRQNVHTEQVVTKIKMMVEIILKIPVPAEYAGLKTSGEIIMECNLSRRSAWQMMAKYCQDENIYELGEGIYAKVLNCVWQYIKASPDAADLKKILASEMEDNVGMCAQGNLSRLCNILSGYIDGINPDAKSRSEIIGELLAPLMEIEDYAARHARAITILREHNAAGEELEAWLMPFTE